MAKEYMVVYTINGQGYTRDLPWVDKTTDDEVEAQNDLAMLKVANDSFGRVHEEWIMWREVGEWQRLT